VQRNGDYVVVERDFSSILTCRALREASTLFYRDVTHPRIRFRHEVVWIYPTSTNAAPAFFVVDGFLNHARSDIHGGVIRLHLKGRSRDDICTCISDNLRLAKMRPRDDLESARQTWAHFHPLVRRGMRPTLIGPPQDLAFALLIDGSVRARLQNGQASRSGCATGLRRAPLPSISATGISAR
jgi:hypothetical protein